MDNNIKNPVEFIKRKKDDAMSRFKKLFTAIMLILLSSIAWAQNGTKKVEMADLMRSNGRIYVVVAVMLTILIGLVLYVARLDKKISKMEKEK